METSQAQSVLTRLVGNNSPNNNGIISVIATDDNGPSMAGTVTIKTEDKSSSEQPFLYCRIVAEYPVTSFLLTLSVHVTLAVATMVLFVRGYDIFPTYFQDLPIDLNEVPYKSRSYAWHYKNDFPNRTRRFLRDPAFRYWPGKIESYSFTLNLVYESKEGNIFSKPNLQTIQQIERDLISVHNYSKFCATQDPTLQCKGIQSIITFFDGTFAHINPVFNDTNFENVSAVLYEASNNNYTKAMFKYFLPQTYTLTSSSARASITRTKIPIGVHNDKETKNFLRSEIKPKLIKWKDSSKQFNMYYISWFYFYEELVTQTLYDMYFVGGSICFIFCFMVFHTRSLWITFWAVLSICTSYLGSNIIYRYIIGYQYFGYFHVVTMFIILGIGADDLFVFYDIWRLTSSSSYTSLAHRLADAYSKSMFSMFITSLTTAVAFFASATSPFLCTKSFGIFSGILVMINYISIITFFPTVVILYHVKFESCSWSCICRCENKKLSATRIQNNVFELELASHCNPGRNVDTTSESQADAAGHHISTSVSISKNNCRTEECKYSFSSVSLENVAARCVTRGVSTKCMNTTNRLSTGGHNQINSVKTHNEKARHKQLFSYGITSLFSRSPNYVLIIFMRDYYFRFITDKHMRVMILLFFACVMVFFSFHATRLIPDNEQVQFFKDGHNFAKVRYLTTHGFQKSGDDRYATVYILWGVKERDRSSCNFTSVNCRGQQVYDDEFNPNPPENQLALKMFCDRLYNLSDSEISKLKIRKNSNGDLQIACFTRNMEHFFARMLTKVQNVTIDISNYSLNLPWNYSQAMQLMEALPQYYYGRFNKSFTDYIDIPLQFWLLNGNTLTHSTDFTLFDDLIGEQKTIFSRKPVFDFPTHYGNKIKYLSIQINTTIDKYKISYTEGIPIIERWETFVNKQMKEMPKGVENGFQLTKFQWDWMYVQQSMANNAIFGIILGVTLAFPIITITTMNIIIGIMATVTICCTTVCVIGIIPLAGWKLGLLVSLNMCIVVGLSVDYVVHLAEGYHLSKHKDRLLRTRDMLESMGSPVISGAITTLGAALFLFFCQIQFALQFGVFLFCNIGFSLLFSLGLFSTVMGLIGPENDTGSLTKLYSCCLSYLRKRKKYTVNGASST